MTFSHKYIPLKDGFSSTFIFEDLLNYVYVLGLDVRLGYRGIWKQAKGQGI